MPTRGLCLGAGFVSNEGAKIRWFEFVKSADTTKGSLKKVTSRKVTG